MRERFWLWLRTSRFVRELYDIPFLSTPMKVFSQLVVPSDARRMLRVRSGLAKGLIFELRPRWEIQLWEGQYERDIQRLLAEKLKPGSVVYDVGAGFGFYSVLAARLGAQVFAFEPEPYNAESLLRHARLNSLESSVELARAAVLEKSGFAQLVPAGQAKGHGSGHIVKNGKPEQEMITVPCTTLDDFAARNPLPNIIKIDVEGAESEVLRGAEQLFRLCQPDVICEVHDATNASFVFEWFSRRRYTLSWIENRANFPKHLVAVFASQVALNSKTGSAEVSIP
jgi:FkbM family methyltransferase